MNNYLAPMVFIVVDALIVVCISPLFKAPKITKEGTNTKKFLIVSSLAGLGGVLLFLIILGNVGAGLWILSGSLNFNVLTAVFAYGSPFVFLGVSINTFLRWMFWKKLDEYTHRNVK